MRCAITSCRCRCGGHHALKFDNRILGTSIIWESVAVASFDVYPASPTSRNGADDTALAPTSWLVLPTINLGAGIDVVGESYHQDALRGLCGQTGGQGLPRRVFTAQLVREPDNPRDPNAVRVDIGGLPVGHLSKEDAPRFHSVIKRLCEQGQAPTARAVAAGGWTSEAQIGVKLLTSRTVKVWNGRAPFFSRLPWHEQAPIVLLPGAHPRPKSLVHLLVDAGHGALAVRDGQTWIGHVVARPDLVALCTRVLDRVGAATAELTQDADTWSIALVDPDALAQSLAALPAGDLRTLRRSVAPTGRWRCARCDRIWFDTRRPVPGWYDVEADGQPHVCPGCWSYAMTHPW